MERTNNMTVEEYQQFLEYIGTIDVLEGIDDFAPDWKPLTEEEYHNRYIEKIKAGIPEGKITQEMFDFWVADGEGTLDLEDRAIAHKAFLSLAAKKQPRLSDTARFNIAAIDAAVKQGASVVTVDDTDEETGGVRHTFTI